MTIHILSREFWRTFWISIRRARKDARDRKNVLRFIFFLLISILYYGRLVWISVLAGGQRRARERWLFIALQQY